MDRINQVLNGENISILLFFIGLYGVIARKNIVKTIISIGIMDAAAVLFFISINFKSDMIPPIMKGNEALEAASVADPLPQAVMITAIVIGIGVTAVSVTMFNNLYHTYGTTNWSKALNKRVEHED